MLRFLLLAALVLAVAAPVHAQASAQNPALHKLFADEWERGLRESPESATYNGDNRFNDRWSDFSLPAIAARAAADRAALEALHAIDRKTLSAASARHSMNTSSRSVTRVGRRPLMASPRSCRSPRSRITRTG